MPDIKITSLEGQEFSAYCALPAMGHGPGLIVIQEIFGVNANLRKICDDYAAQGYVAVCPDLFWRQEPDVQLTDQSKEEWARAFELYKGFDVEAGIRDLLSTLGHIRKMHACNGKVGAIGYCLGGKLAFLMSTRSDVDASVSYYGVELDKYVDEIHDIRMPLMLHIAELDKFSSPAARDKLLRSITRNPVIIPYVYQGVDHAFARIGGEHFNQAAADLAASRTTAFLAEHLQA
jgi:carboxymethylenebutenolidase